MVVEAVESMQNTFRLTSRAAGVYQQRIIFER
jgi:hypothetical protein